MDPLGYSTKEPEPQHGLAKETHARSLQAQLNELGICWRLKHDAAHLDWYSLKRGLCGTLGAKVHVDALEQNVAGLPQKSQTSVSLKYEAHKRPCIEDGSLIRGPSPLPP